MQALASSTKPLAYQLEGHRLVTSLPYLDPRPSEAQLKLVAQLVQDELAPSGARAGQSVHPSAGRTAERPLAASTSFHLGDLEKDIETPVLDRLLQSRLNKQQPDNEESGASLGKRVNAGSSADSKPVEKITTRDEYDATVLEVERMKQR